MAGNSKKRRKPGRSARLGVIPIQFRTDHESERNLKLIPHQELLEIREGRGTEVSYHTLAGRLNFGGVMAAMVEGFEPDPRPIIRDAQLALLAMRARYEKIGYFGLSEEEISAIGDGLNACDDMQDATTRRQHRDAMRIVFQAAE